MVTHPLTSIGTHKHTNTYNFLEVLLRKNPQLVFSLWYTQGLGTFPKSFWSWIRPLYPELILRDRVLHEAENSFIALPGKRGHSRLMPSKLCVPTWRGVVRSFTVMVQRGCDQLMDFLLIGWWWGKWESASSTFWFQPVWGLRACEQHTVNFSHLVGVSVSAEQLKDIVVCIPWGGARTLPQGHTIVSFDCSILVSTYPLFPI